MHRWIVCSRLQLPISSYRGHAWQHFSLQRYYSALISHQKRGCLLFSHDISKATAKQVSENLRWISLSFSQGHTKQRGDRSGSHTQVNALKFRAPSAHSRHPWFIREVWWRWLLRRASQCPLGNWIHRGKILRKPEPSPTDLEGQCAYSITRCGVSAWLGRWGLAGGFFWKVSDKLSPCPPPTPFPNPARSCFADRSARRRETRAPWWDYFTVYTRGSIGFLSRPRHIISITLTALKTKKKACL